MQTTTLIYAHRGANKEAAENTRAAFNKALEYAIDGMETDVQLSCDEVPVLWHDRWLNKLGLPDKHIDDYDYARLCAMDFAHHFPGHATVEPVVSLRDFLVSYRPRCRLLIEIKNREWETRDRHESKVRQTLELVGAAQSDAIFVSSFDLNSLIYAHQYQADFPLVYNIDTNQTVADVHSALAGQPFLRGYCLPIEMLDGAVVELLRRHGKHIAVYTCNSDEEISRALQLGVDILISDIPQKALALRDRLAEENSTGA